MIGSHSRLVTFRRAPAVLSVIRNNGSCWGRLITAQGVELDVVTRRDWYDQGDEDALDAFERASRNPRCVSAACGWLSSNLSREYATIAAELGLQQQWSDATP